MPLQLLRRRDVSKSRISQSCQPSTPTYSARPHAEFLRNDLHPDRIFTYQLRRTWNYGLAFYFRREIPEWSPQDPDAALVLTSREGFEKIEKAGRFRGRRGALQQGILYVPVQLPRASSRCARDVGGKF